MKLQDLTGHHVLDGVDAKLRRLSDKESSVLLFRLDGIVFSATKDAQLEIVNDANIDNFAPVEVIGLYSTNDVWALIDANTGRPIIKIGLCKSNQVTQSFDSTAMSINNF